jgi:hypothetical protein
MEENDIIGFIRRVYLNFSMYLLQEVKCGDGFPGIILRKSGFIARRFGAGGDDGTIIRRA